VINMCIIVLRQTKQRITKKKTLHSQAEENTQLKPSPVASYNTHPKLNQRV